MPETDHRLGTSSRHSQVTLELIHESQVLIFSNSHPYGPRGPEVRGVDGAKNLDKSSQKPEESL